MNRNYYDILEINKNASSEIIKKAYTTLAKKYHPDLQENELKKDFEEKLKLINEAYEVLSNEEKRKQYDIELSKLEPDTEKLITENINLKNELNYLRQSINIPNTPDKHIPHYTNESFEYENQFKFQQELKYQQQIEQAKKMAYHDAYIQDLKKRGYKIRYKRTFRDYVKNFIALLLTLFILFLLCQIPLIHNFLTNIYEENPIINTLVNLILNIFR